MNLKINALVKINDYEFLNPSVYRILKRRITKRDLKQRARLLEGKMRKMHLLHNACRGIIAASLLYLVLSDLLDIFGVKKVPSF